MWSSAAFLTPQKSWASNGKLNGVRNPKKRQFCDRSGDEEARLGSSNRLVVPGFAGTGQLALSFEAASFSRNQLQICAERVSTAIGGMLLGTSGVRFRLLWRRPQADQKERLNGLPSDVDG